MLPNYFGLEMHFAKIVLQTTTAIEANLWNVAVNGFDIKVMTSG